MMGVLERAVTAVALPGVPEAIHVHLMQAGPCDPTQAGLDDEERAQGAAFRFAEDRDAYLSAHALRRLGLSAMLGGRPSQWRFRPGPYGKPMLDPPQGVSVNLSHTRGWAACVMSREHTVGIDIEAPRDGIDDPSLQETVLAPSERQDMDAAPDAAARMQRFLTYWTLKEAFLKAAGRGLSIPPDTVEIARVSDGMWRVVRPGFTTSPDRWSLVSCSAGQAGVRLAVAWIDAGEHGHG